MIAVYLDNAEEAIRTLQAVSEAKDEEIETLKASLEESTTKNIRYESESKVKAFLLGNVILGWQDSTVVWGAQIGAGVKLSNWMFQGGLLYKDFSSWDTNSIAFFTGVSYLF